MELRRSRLVAVVAVLHTLVCTSLATVSFPQIQPIVGFSPPCNLAYNTPVANCDINDFSALGGTSTCSADCQASLQAAQRFVQRLCQGQQATSSSLIGKLFVGDVVNFLCGDNNGAAVASTTAGVATTGQATSAIATAAATSDTSTPASQASTAASTTGSAISSTTSTTASSSSSIPTSIASATASFTTSTTSRSSSTSSSSSSSAAAARTSGPQGSGIDSGGGSPFDSVSGNGASQSSKSISSPLLSLLCIGAVIYGMQ